MKILEHGRGLIVGLEKFNLSDYPNAEAVGCNMTSCEHLPLKEIEERGIKLISLKGETKFLESITSTAEHTVGLMIALLRNYKIALVYNDIPRDKLNGHTLSDKTLGIIGYGRIGKQVKKMAKAFRMNVLTYEKNEPNQKLYTLLGESDIITIHIPLQENEVFFTQKLFKMMKPTSYLINTSRDDIIEKGALIWALKNNIIQGAAIDFIDDQELVEYSKEHSNLILTNHQGGNTIEDRGRTEDFIIKKVEQYIYENRFNKNT